jgi:aspartyl-tRNA(Asn)/glutamyl-tRNA(Gln) amidotransferase subunit C
MITKQEVEHIAKLARLGLTETETRRLQKDLSSILDYFNLLREVNVSKVKPTSHSVFVESVTREDKTKETSPELANRLIKAAPDRKGRHVRVKAVL